MRLGGSLRRTRSPGRKTRKGWEGAVWRFLAPRLEVLRSRRFLLLLGLVCLGSFTGGYFVSTGILFPAPPPPGDLTQVPGLGGEPLPSAAEILSEAGLHLGDVDSIRHPTLSSGKVVGQSPLAGQLSLVGDTVRVVVSLGPEERPVPDVMRLRADRAQLVLEASGFRVLVDSVEAEVPRGTVVSMEPEAGTETTIPDEIVLSVSMGPPMVEMPLLLGLREEQARAVADSVGLVVAEVETRFRFGRDQGLVVEQQPPAATMVERGQAIRLVVGRRGG